MSDEIRTTYYDDNTTEGQSKLDNTIDSSTSRVTTSTNGKMKKKVKTISGIEDDTKQPVDAELMEGSNRTQNMFTSSEETWTEATDVETGVEIEAADTLQRLYIVIGVLGMLANTFSKSNYKKIYFL